MADQRTDRLARSCSRRELIRVGGLGALGVSLPLLAGARRRGADRLPAGSRPRATSCLLIFLSGGPPQHETFDPKPAAPIEIRGPFLPIATSVAGIQFCELLPRTAMQAGRMCVIRSMTTGIHSHSTSGCFMLTGHEPVSVAESVPPSAQDWPSIAGAVGALRPAERSPLDAVVIPEPIFNNPAIPWPGQNGGFMGAAWHPHLLRCDPSADRIEIDGLTALAGMTSLRLDDRRDLLGQLDRHRHRAINSPAMTELDRFQQEAFDLLHSGATREALAIEREPAASRDRYGRGKFGQSLLLGRRLIEAGVRLVQVNWPREPGDMSAGNPLWDTHQDNAGRLKNVLCPQFDVAYSALLEDLHARGMLDETLVVVMGEFGRTPAINAGGGRDHWGSVFSVALAGGGVPGGSVIGSSDDRGALPADRPARPPDLAATIFQLLGIPPDHEFRDPLNRPLSVITGGRPLREIVGG
ncbi:MAG: DUF1501 domain-containing protein [Planctomycetota bacterium]|nr:MAG: DUF1501 domain-containing protein [Planctomycetota bacterium]